jgi:hypothetical protein
MKTTQINSIAELHEKFGTYEPSTTIYRGLKSIDFELKTSIVRIEPPPSSKTKEKNEREILRLFKEKSIPFLNYIPTTDWDWLALGQHQGLPTRLMDWTRNPLVASYFAVEEEWDGDSAIYAYHNNWYISIEKHPDPFVYKRVGKFIPKHVTPRITAQEGLFTIHPDLYNPFDSNEIEKIVIPNAIRRSLKKNLNTYGIDRYSLFPDINGLTTHIKWLRSKGH